MASASTDAVTGMSSATAEGGGAATMLLVAITGAIIRPGRGRDGERQFVTVFLQSLQVFLAADQLHLAYQQWIEPTTHQILFSKSLDRSVTGSMNDLVFQARLLLAESELPLIEISSKIGRHNV